MPDITDQILAEIEDLPPSGLSVLEYQDKILYTANCEITSEWSTNEISTNLLGWVKAGLLMTRVCRCRLYRDKFKSWQQYCEEAIGKTQWQAKRIMESAKVVHSLAIAGFSILPNCVSQASSLVRYLSSVDLLIEKWQQVISRVPRASITQNSIDEELGHVSKKKKKKVEICDDTKYKIERRRIEDESCRTYDDAIRNYIDEAEANTDPVWGLTKPLQKKIRNEAKKRGVSTWQVMQDNLEKSYGEDEAGEDNEEDPDEVISEDDPDYQIRMAIWEQDLEKLVAEHDRATVATAIWFKLFNPAIFSKVAVP